MGLQINRALESTQTAFDRAAQEGKTITLTSDYNEVNQALPTNISSTRDMTRETAQLTLFKQVMLTQDIGFNIKVFEGYIHVKGVIGNAEVDLPMDILLLEPGNAAILAEIMYNPDPDTVLPALRNWVIETRLSTLDWAARMFVITVNEFYA